MKGIILGGGNGSRLYPATSVTNKLLVPIYDKPLVYYPLSTLMEAGIKDVMIISNKRDQDRFKMLFEDGSRFGMHISYGVQEVPTGTASAFLIGEEFIKDEACALILGDNIFYGKDLSKSLVNAAKKAEEGITSLYGYKVPDPERFGVVELDGDKAVSLEEKPKNPKSNIAVTGLYFYPSDVVAKAKQVKPSWRNEYEITDLNKMYLDEDRVRVEVLGDDADWLDAGTFDSNLEASELIAKKEKEGHKIAIPEILAYRNGWISKEELKKAGEALSKNSYGQMILSEIVD